MKLISLNLWGGKIYQPLVKFVEKNNNTDVFCFQEVYTTSSTVKGYKNIIRANLLEELVKLLPDFKVFYSPEISGFDDVPDPVNFNLTVGKAVFVKKNLIVNSYDDLLLYGNRSEKNLKKNFSNMAVSLQSVNVTFNDKQYLICNFHGTCYPRSKLDTKLRLEHSKKIIELLKEKTGYKIVVGDFNLLPETQSIKILAGNMKNLIKEFNIPRTRSNLSPFFGKPNFQKFADYIFVSPELKVLNFKALKDKVSDHLPLYLEFN